MIVMLWLITRDISVGRYNQIQLKATKIKIYNHFNKNTIVDSLYYSIVHIIIVDIHTLS